MCSHPCLQERTIIPSYCPALDVCYVELGFQYKIVYQKQLYNKQNKYINLMANKQKTHIIIHFVHVIIA